MRCCNCLPRLAPAHRQHLAPLRAACCWWCCRCATTKSPCAWTACGAGGVVTHCSTQRLPAGGVGLGGLCQLLLLGLQHVQSGVRGRQIGLLLGLLCLQCGQRLFRLRQGVLGAAGLQGGVGGNGRMFVRAAQRAGFARLQRLAVGPSGYERNAVRLGFANYADHFVPRIDDIALLDANDQRLHERRDGRLLVPRDGGGLQLVVEAWDQVDGNLPRRRLGLYALGYQLLDAQDRALPGYAQPRMNIEFNRMPPQPDAVKLAYAADSGITVHGAAATRFRHVLTNTVRDGRLAAGALQPAELPAGDYTLRITARDYSGNEAGERRELPITVF